MRLDQYFSFELVREVPGCHLWNAKKRRHLRAYMQCGQRASSKALATFKIDRDVGLSPSRSRGSQPWPMSARRSEIRYSIATIGDIHYKASVKPIAMHEGRIR